MQRFPVIIGRVIWVPIFSQCAEFQMLTLLGTMRKGVKYIFPYISSTRRKNSATPKYVKETSKRAEIWHEDA